jgi:hypothetical protein
MRVLDTHELERLVRITFPGKREFRFDHELGPGPAQRWPVVTFVHSGTDALLDRDFDEWLRGLAPFVSVQQLLNRLCRAGALPPGEYAITRER